MLTVTEAAAELEVSPRTLRRRLREAFPDRRRGTRIDPSDLDVLRRHLGLVLTVQEPRV